MSVENIQSYRDVILSLHQKLEDATELTGWLHYPEQNHEELLGQIEQLAAEIRQEADVLIVVGVGGSFLGARAILDALTPYFGRQMQGIEVIYIGDFKVWWDNGTGTCFSCDASVYGGKVLPSNASYIATAISFISAFANLINSLRSDSLLLL